MAHTLASLLPQVKDDPAQIIDPDLFAEAATSLDAPEQRRLFGPARRERLLTPLMVVTATVGRSGGLGGAGAWHHAGGHSRPDEDHSAGNGLNSDAFMARPLPSTRSAEEHHVMRSNSDRRSG